MLEVKNLVKIYRPKKGVPVTALDNVSLKFPDKGMIFLLGKSGCGKSTLLNVIGGLDRYDEGEVLIKGVSSKKFRQSHFDSYRNTYVGFIFQEYNILDEFTVGANIALALQLQGKKATDEAIEDILRQVDLAGFGSRKPNELSGGQKQRIAIARALVKSPEIIMADEPTGALDSNTGKQVFDTLKKLSEQKLVIIVSHDRDFAEGYADRIIELADGKVISDVSLDTSEDANKRNLTYRDNTVTLAEGYHLTEEDRIAINRYIDAMQGGSFSVVARRANRRFRETSESDTVQSGGSFRLIKSRLPLRYAFRMGASGLKHKKVRLVFTILLSCIAFGLFALADTMAGYDLVNTYTDSILDSNIRYASMEKRLIRNTETQSRPITDADIAILREKLGGAVTGVYAFGEYEMQIQSFTDNSGDLFAQPEKGSDDALYLRAVAGFAEADEQMLRDAGVSLIAGRMPDGTKNEIVISSYLCQSFIKWGYTEHEVMNVGDPPVFDKEYMTEEEYEKILLEYQQIKDKDLPGNQIAKHTIRTAEEMLNRRIVIRNEFYTIVGITDASPDLSRYTILTEGSSNASFTNLLLYSAAMAELESETTNSLAGIAIVGTGWIAENGKDDLPSYPINDQIKIVSETLDSKRFTSDMPDAVHHIEATLTRIGKLSDVNPNNVLWLDSTPRTELAENEIILHSMFFEDAFLYLDENGEKPYSVYQNDYAPGNYAHSVFLEENERPDLSYCGLTFTCEGQTFRVVGLIIDPNVGYDSYAVGKYSDAAVFPDGFVDRRAKTDGGFTNLYAKAFGAMPEDRAGVFNLVKYCYEGAGDRTQFPLQNPVCEQLDMTDVIFDIISPVCLWIGVGFAIFASLLLSNFISTSISYKRRQIGILRAIGSRGNDVFRIFFSESFIIAMINFVISSIGTLFIVSLINAVLRSSTGLLVTLLHFGPRQIALLFAVSILVAFVASFLPVKRIASMRPIDAIRNI